MGAPQTQSSASAVPRGMPSVYTNTSKLKPVERKQATLWESGIDRENIREGLSAQEVASSNLPPDPNRTRGYPRASLECWSSSPSGTAQQRLVSEITWVERTRLSTWCPIVPSNHQNADGSRDR